jgi:hypothetical protein
MWHDKGSIYAQQKVKSGILRDVVKYQDHKLTPETLVVDDHSRLYLTQHQCPENSVHTLPILSANCSQPRTPSSALFRARIPRDYQTVYQAVALHS